MQVIEIKVHMYKSGACGRLVAGLELKSCHRRNQRQDSLRLVTLDGKQLLSALQHDNYFKPASMTRSVRGRNVNLDP